MKKKIFNKLVYLGIILFISTAPSCKKALEEDNFSQLSTKEFLSTEAGINALSISAYSNAQFNTFPMNVKINFGELPTDIMFQAGGGVAGNAAQLYNFTWNPTMSWFNDQCWNKQYRAIRDANILLDNIDNAPLSDLKKKAYQGEARFLRAYMYYLLYIWYGPVPLSISSTESKEIKRASEAEMNAFLEKEFIEAADLLPTKQAEYGRATKGAALGFLTKFYLNTKQWQKCANAAQMVMNLNLYDLFPDYVNMFKVENEINKEFIYVSPCISLAGQGNQWMAVSFPATFPRLSNQASFASNYKLYDSFVNSFPTNDKRKECILTSYKTAAGATITLLGKNDSRSFKYFPDPNSLSSDANNDFPELRFSDILLARSEALNEISGPNAESITLINRVRIRANVSLLILGTVTKNSFRDAILSERLWEFFTEGFRREDLLRHGKFISGALARGKAAQDFQMLYPIPQAEISVSKIDQNPGYN
ncbi:RagB/SusD family nutrient uptake outer membrane protein [Daejeonella sp.]|uniref:RagB/SusD family nutrient uptake outer membrane protein n=1 Tax=Daejeonella sp. TaxID=2805397 RepID=UPI0030C21E61